MSYTADTAFDTQTNPQVAAPAASHEYTHEAGAAEALGAYQFTKAPEEQLTAIPETAYEGTATATAPRMRTTTEEHKDKFALLAEANAAWAEKQQAAPAGIAAADEAPAPAPAPAEPAQAPTQIQKQAARTSRSTTH